MDESTRLDALERRVSDLEAQLRRPPSLGAADETPDADVFWALEGLRARVDDPGAVLMTGHVRLPDGRTAQWQESAGTDDVVSGDWTDLADPLAALGHPVRLRLLQAVLSGAATVHDLLQTDGVGTTGQVYHHLRQLTSAGWLRAVGGGRYEVPVARVVPLLVVVLGARR
jgi:hypothetical protein